MKTQRKIDSSEKPKQQYIVENFDQVSRLCCLVNLSSKPFRKSRQSGLEIKKIFRSPFGDKLEKCSRQVQIFSRQFVWCKWSSSQYQLGFCYLARSLSREFHEKPENPLKFTIMCQIPWNSREILSNTCWYNIFETYLGYWGRLIAESLQIYLETSSPQCAKNVSKLPGVNYVAKNWALVMMLKALPLVHFSSALLLEYVRLSLLQTLHTVVKSVQNQSISSEICPENSHEIGCFAAKLPVKISAKSVSENPVKFYFRNLDRNIWNFCFNFTLLI